MGLHLPEPEPPPTRREQLQEILENLIGPDGKVYFQPPPNIIITYPCIVYKRRSAQALHAGNQLYKRVKRYELQIITRDPDSDIPEKVAKLPLCSFDRFYIADNLNHDVYSIYF